jgi:hypothetical protein
LSNSSGSEIPPPSRTSRSKGAARQISCQSARLRQDAVGFVFQAFHLLTVPPAWWLAVAVLVTLAVVAGLAALPARIGARRPAAEILQAETA